MIVNDLKYNTKSFLFHSIQYALGKLTFPKYFSSEEIDFQLRVMSRKSHAQPLLRVK